MDEKRIARIIELEGSAVRPEKIASAVRWETAYLYSEEAASGTPQTEIAKRVGRSNAHITYMIKAWKTVQFIFSGDYDDLPPFSEAYRSREVRGSGAGTDSGTDSQGAGSPDGRDRTRSRRPPDDIHSIVSRILYNVSLLSDVSGSWPALGDDERDWLKEASNTLRQSANRTGSRIRASNRQ
jgi:hypothetical protein